MKYILILSALWYTTTSFITTTDRSIAVIPTESFQLLKSVPTDSFGYFQEYEIDISAGELYHLRFDQPFTSVKIQRIDSQPSVLTLSVGEEIYQVGLSTDPMENIEPSETFIVFDSPLQYFSIQGDLSQKIRLSLLYAAPVEITIPTLKNKKDGCDKPMTIPQSEWRKGLPAPKPGRNSTVVKHCIIHHSAGSNSDTNYVNTVRNIYLLHTNTNGWDDIGYNYVVAPNGWIFDGRDAQNVADADNIQGAHFCAKNGGTMGVCLLGNYNTATPSAEMINSLQAVLTWKLHKEGLDTRDAYPHPTSLGEELPTVAMHRDGCATECPGENIAAALPDWRVDVQEQLDACNGSVAVEEPKLPKYQLLVYPNPSDGRFFAMIEKSAKATDYQLVSTSGQIAEKGILPTNGYVKTEVANGTYILHLLAKDVPVATHRLIIRRK